MSAYDKIPFDDFPTMLRKSLFALKVIKESHKEYPSFELFESVWTYTAQERSHCHKYVARFNKDETASCFEVIRNELTLNTDEQSRPMNLHLLIAKNARYSGLMPVNERTGYKLAFLFYFANGLVDLRRIELIARWIFRMSREEAAYNYSFASADYLPKVASWGKEAYRILLSGPEGSPALVPVLNQMRLLHP